VISYCRNHQAITTMHIRSDIFRADPRLRCRVSVTSPILDPRFSTPVSLRGLRGCVHSSTSQIRRSEYSRTLEALFIQERLQRYKTVLSPPLTLRGSFINSTGRYYSGHSSTRLHPCRLEHHHTSNMDMNMRSQSPKSAAVQEGKNAQSSSKAP
jgi:hypothetical protein